MSTAPALRTRAIAILLCLVAFPAAITAYIAIAEKPETIAKGQRLDAIDVKTLDHHSMQLPAAGSRGRIWLVVSASCPICRQELTEMERHPPAEPVTVISFSSLQDTEAFMRQFQNMRARTVVDDHKRLENQFGKFRFPTAVVLDENGGVVAKWRGRRDKPYVE